MTQKKAIEPSSWSEFLTDFSKRNRGRRARFEIFGVQGSVSEETREGVFESASINGRVVKIDRSYDDDGTLRTMTDDLHDVHGIEVQFDVDNTEDTIEFTDHNGDMTVLHFESNIDGDS